MKEFRHSSFRIVLTAVSFTSPSPMFQWQCSFYWHPLHLAVLRFSLQKKGKYVTNWVDSNPHKPSRSTITTSIIGFSKLYTNRLTYLRSDHKIFTSDNRLLSQSSKLKKIQLLKKMQNLNDGHLEEGAHKKKFNWLVGAVGSLVGQFLQDSRSCKFSLLLIYCCCC